MSDWLLALPAAGLVFLLPGWAMLRLWPGAHRLTLAEQLTLGLGVGFALHPVLILVTGTLGLNLGALYAWLPTLFALPFLVVSLRRGHGPPLAGWRVADKGALWAEGSLLVVVAVAAWVRLAAVAELRVPLWGDSVHHGAIVQLMLDHGGLFSSWEPYAAMTTFTYHFGFHSHAAVLAWAIGLPAPRAVVLAGQVANLAATVALYPLATRLGHSRWAGVAAVLVAALLGPMPMHYVNWGRYTQLAGQAILPGAILLAWELLAARRLVWPLLGLATLTMAGMVLTHYRIAIFAACFFPAFVLIHGLRLPWRVWLGRGALLAAGAAIIIAPWAIRVLGGQLLVVMGSIVASAAVRGGSGAGADTLQVMGGPLFFLPPALWYGMLLSLFWAIWRRAQGALLIAFWWLLVALIVNPQLLGLPGAGTLTNFALLIAVYIPAALLIGAATGWLMGRLRSQGAQVGATIIVAALAFWGAGPRLQEVDVNTRAMVSATDLDAAAWIEANTPAEARFLINGFFPNEGAVVGSDAGWWLPVLAQRRTTLPPILYISEQGPRPDYRLWVNELYATIRRLGVTHPTTIAMLRERGVTHVYLGQRGGTVGYEGNEEILRPEVLQSSPFFRPVYQEAQVWVFALEPEETGAGRP